MHKTLIRLTYLVAQLTLLLLFTVNGNAVELRASSETLNIHTMPEEEKIIIWGFMRELDLPNPFEKPNPKPTPPRPKPTPTPTPAPPKPPTPPVEVTDNDNFLWENDDFLNDKRSYVELRDEYDRQYRKIKQKWDKRLEERLSIWRKPTKDFLSFHDSLVAQAVEASSYIKLGDQSELSYSSVTTKGFDSMKPGDFHVIPQSLQIPIRSQAYRGTCVAFAYVRGMESIFASYGSPVDLSENHFYWIAKDQCRTPGKCACTLEQRKNPANKCVDDGLRVSKTAQLFQQKNADLYIVPESECSYHKFPYPLELTGAPLNECKPFKTPVAKIAKAVNLKSYPQIVSSILNNQPLVIGVRVSKKMMAKQNTPKQQRVGQIVNTLKGDSPNKGGHAMLGIGIIKLQQKHWSIEGRYCLITANSWGKKFGMGGYTCFTENWLRKYLGEAVSLQSLDVQSPFYPKQVY